MQRLVVVTGLSGSGKSLAARCFEDLGYFCVDNLPVALIPPFVELIQRSDEASSRAAIVVDAREGRFLEGFADILQELRAKGLPITLLFLECDDAVLKRRFSETRRPHPMATDGGTLERAIEAERSALAFLRDRADRIVDTTRLTAHELRALLKSAYGAEADQRGPSLHFVSFGYKHGLPAESDLVFDVRFLPNPFFVDALRPMNGTTKPVKDYVLSRTQTQEFLDRLGDLLDYLVPLYAAEGKTYLTVSLGCTGGKHRSVALVEALRERFSDRQVRVSVIHRDIGKE